MEKSSHFIFFPAGNQGRGVVVELESDLRLGTRAVRCVHVRASEGGGADRW